MYRITPGLLVKSLLVSASPTILVVVHSSDRVISLSLSLSLSLSPYLSLSFFLSQAVQLEKRDDLSVAPAEWSQLGAALLSRSAKHIALVLDLL